MPVEFSHIVQIVSIQKSILFKVYRNLTECFRYLASKALGKKNGLHSSFLWKQEINISKILIIPFCSMSCALHVKKIHMKFGISSLCLMGQPAHVYNTK